jgi:hypothetical protein
MFIGIDFFRLAIEIMPKVFTFAGGDGALVSPVLPCFAANAPFIMSEVFRFPASDLPRSHAVVDPLVLMIIPRRYRAPMRSAISAGAAREDKTAGPHQSESGDA